MKNEKVGLNDDLNKEDGQVPLPIDPLDVEFDKIEREHNGGSIISLEPNKEDEKMETITTRSESNQDKKCILIDIPGNQKKGKCWAKHVKSIDLNKEEGFMFEGTFLEEKEKYFFIGDLILYVYYEGSWKNGYQIAMLTQVDEEGENILLENLKWSKNKITIAEKCIELLSLKK